jgi:predicted protein tyrosine phosphatase
MAYSNTIFVTNLFDMPHFVRDLEPARLVSIIQAELQPDRPNELAEHAHHRVEVHDIIEDQPFSVLIQDTHVQALIDFIHQWDPRDGALMTHCYAGVSRSTAAALIAAFMKTTDALGSARALRVAAPYAQPNRRVIALADHALGCEGELIAAVKEMGPATESVVEAPLTVLRIGDPLPRTLD